MRVQIISVGLELLRGEITNTTAPALAQELQAQGLQVTSMLTVDDEEADIQAAVEAAQANHDIIILTGGIGPTQDDLTKLALAKCLRLTLEVDEANLQQIAQAKNCSAAALSAGDRRMAWQFPGAQPLKNKKGMAWGSLFEHQGITYVVLPGVPRECRTMFTEEVLPLWQAAGLLPEKEASAFLNFYGLSEARLSERLQALALPASRWAIYAKADHKQVRLRAKQGSAEENTKQLASDQALLAQAFAPYYLGEGQALNLAEALLSKLRSQDATLSLAESLTGGLAAANLVQIPHASEAFLGSAVTYTAAAKSQMLHISPADLDEEGMVSAFCAKKMAQGIRQALGSTYALSFTGVAGPGQMEGQAVGTVWIGLSQPTGTEAFSYHFSGDRQGIRRQAVNEGYYRLWQLLKQAR